MRSTSVICRRLGFFFLAVCFGFLFQPLELYSLSLDEAYRSALAHRSILQSQALNEKIARRQKLQAIGTVLPRASAGLVGEWEDATRNTRTQDSRSFDHYSRLSLEQSLFQGGSEYFIWKASKYEAEAASAEYEQFRLQLYLEVAEAFFQVHLYRLQLEHLRDRSKILRQQVSYFTDRAKIGQSKDIDVASTKSQLARSEAEILSLEISLQKAEERLRFIVGSDIGEVLQPPKWEIDLDSFPAESLQSNPQLQALEASIQREKALKSASSASFLPEVSVSGDYYPHRSSGSESPSWGVSLMGTWQFFNGFRDYQETAIRNLQLKKLELEYAEAFNRMKAEFAGLRLSLQQQSRRQIALADALRLSEEAYNLQKRDAALNLVSQLEALRALDAFIELRALVDEQRMEQQLDWAKLNILKGQLP